MHWEGRASSAVCCSIASALTSFIDIGTNLLPAIRLKLSGKLFSKSFSASCRGLRVCFGDNASYRNLDPAVTHNASPPIATPADDDLGNGLDDWLDIERPIIWPYMTLLFLNN